MKALLIVLGIFLLLALMFGGKFISVRNELATQNEAINGQWSQVDVALQRRSDLIPNLVNTVKGFATHEQQVIDSVTAARAALGGARTPQEKIAANSQLDGAISRLLVVSENYPNLKADQNFLRLQDELAGTANRLVPQQPDCFHVRFPEERRLLQDRRGIPRGPESSILKGLLAIDRQPAG